MLQRWNALERFQLGEAARERRAVYRHQSRMPLGVIGPQERSVVNVVGEDRKCCERFSGYEDGAAFHLSNVSRDCDRNRLSLLYHTLANTMAIASD